MKNYYNIVKRILTDNSETRDDDMYLYALVVAESGLVGVDEPFYSVLAAAKEKKLPSYESVSRARRKVQEKEPDLRGHRYKVRKLEEGEYREYYSHRL